ncbi:MAG: SpoIIE family protein phosphatase [Pirellulaceae bacterium]
MDESLLARDNARTLEEARFFEYSLDIFCITDLDGTIRRVNHAVEQTLGYPPDELLGRSVLEFVHPEDVEAARDQLRDVQQGQDAIRFEYRALCRDGSYRWLSITCPAPLPESDLLYTVARDVTRRKQAEQNLLEWKKRYDAATTVAGNIVYEWNTETNEVIWGGNPEQLLGHPHRELPTDLAGWLENVHPDDRFDAERVVTDALAEKTPAHLEYRVKRKEGAYVYIRDDAQYFSDADGRLVRMIGVITDISNLSKVEHELRAARALQQQLYPDAAPQLAGFDIAGAAVPAAMAGGDYYDFIPLTDDKVVLAVGDVSGHGLSSALQMIEVRAYLRAILGPEQDCSTVVERLNRFLIGDTLEGSFVSLFLAHLDASTRALSYIGAGHDARVVRANGDVEPLRSSGLVLGVVPNLVFPRSTTFTMDRGDVLVVVTDGITEAHSESRQLFEYARVLDVVSKNRDSSAEVIIEAIYAAVNEFSGGRPLSDDMTAMIVKAL